jgi:hypothetical protein
MKELTSTQRADEIASIQLSNRQSHGEYVTYTALSSDGVTTYTVTLHNGKATGCECPHHVYRAAKCKHMQAAAFEEAWGAPVVLGEMIEDLEQHVVDSIESGEMAIGTCATCPNSVKPGFVFCPWCSGSAAA